MNVVYVTGNENKARLFNEMLGLELAHHKVEVEEIQSLDLSEVAAHKAKAAYAKLSCPVLVEDTKLTFTALGALPGPLIKWFLEELGTEGLCRLLDGRDRSAIAGSAIAYYDGEVLKIFEKDINGSISKKPKGKSGWGWDPIFIPDGYTKTHGQLSFVEYRKAYKNVKPFGEVKKFLQETKN